MSESAEAAVKAARANWPALRRRRRPGENLTIWQARPKRELAFLVWGGIVAAWTHWTGIRTLGCPGRQHECLWCGVQVPRVKWYVGAWALEFGDVPEERPGRCVVELTLAARRGCPALGMGSEVIMRRRLLLGRRGQRRMAEAFVRLSDAPSDSLPMGRQVDPAQVLRRVWTQGPDCLDVAQVDRLLQLAAPVNVEVDLPGGRL